LQRCKLKDLYSAPLLFAAASFGNVECLGVTPPLVVVSAKAKASKILHVL